MWLQSSQDDLGEEATLRLNHEVLGKCPVVKISFSNAEGIGVISGLGSKFPHALHAKNKMCNRSYIVINSMKTLKVVYIKNMFFLKKGEIEHSKKRQS